MLDCWIGVVKQCCFLSSRICTKYTLKLMKTNGLYGRFNSLVEIEDRIKMYEDFVAFLNERRAEKKKITKAQNRVLVFMKKWILEYVGYHSSNGRTFSDNVIRVTFEMMFPTKNIVHDVYLGGLSFIC